MQCFPDSLYSFVGADHLLASSCGWSEGIIVDQLPAFGARCDFYYLICNDHFLRVLALVEHIS